MSGQPNWEFRLADSETQERIMALTEVVGAKSFQPAFNLPGSVSFTVPIESNFARAVKKHSTCIIARRNGKDVWGGAVSSIKDNVDGTGGSETTQVTALGWLEELNHRFLWAAEETSARYTDAGITGGAIAMSLLEILNSRKTVSGVPVPTHLSPGEIGDVQTRKRTYTRGQNIGGAISELVSVENGMDIFVDPVLRQLSTRAPDDFVDRRNVHYRYGDGMAATNVERAERTEDGTKTVNTVTVVGANNISVVVQDEDAIAAHGGIIIEDWISLSDVSDKDILLAYAEAELTFRNDGDLSLSVTPSSLGSSGSVYRLYDDFELGDQVYFSAKRGRMQLSAVAMRVFGVTLSIDTEGNETMSELQIRVA